jgi:serine/threonine-protein kinase HipA
VRAELDVYLDGARVGVITDVGAGLYTFRYLDGVGRAGQLSTSLPVSETTFLAGSTRPFFEGLLPEDRVRRDVARQLGIDVEDSVSMLAAIGIECAGAVSVVPAGVALPTERDVEWLSPDQLIDRIEGLPSFPLGRDERTRSRASLAGAQRKMVAIVDADRVGVPLGTAPSTHLLKPQWNPGADDPQIFDVVANEAFCMRLAAAAGCAVASVEPRRIGSRWVLFVERFDRVRVAGGMVRVHQEDIGQAAGVLPRSKYEQDGGIGLDVVAQTLTRAGIARITATSRLLDAVVIAAAIGNADQHAKNLGVLYAELAQVAPLYDLMSTVVYEELSKRSAFVVGGELYIDEVDDEACVRAAIAWGMPERVARRRVSELTNRLHNAAGPVLAEAEAQAWATPLLGSLADLVQTWPERAREQ